MPIKCARAHTREGHWKEAIRWISELFLFSIITQVFCVTWCRARRKEMLGTTKPVGISQHSVVLMFVHPSTVFFDTLTTPSKKIHSLSLCRHLPLPSVTLAQGASLVSLPTVGLILEVFPGAPLKHSSRWPSKYSNGWISKQTSGLVKTCDVCSNNNNTQILGSLLTFSCLLSHL